MGGASLGDDVVAIGKRLARPTDITLVPGEPRAKQGDSQITFDNRTGDVAITAPRNWRTFYQPITARFAYQNLLGLQISGGSEQILGLSFAQRYGLTSFRLDTGYDAPGGKSYLSTAAAMRDGAYFAIGNPPSAAAIYQRRREQAFLNGVGTGALSLVT